MVKDSMLSLRTFQQILQFLLVVIIAVACTFFALYLDRIKSMLSIDKITSYPDYNLYAMDIQYNYHLDSIIKSGVEDETIAETLIREALPFIPIHMTAPNFGCSVLNLASSNGKFLTGRNYDFKLDTSAMMVYCHPKNGYKSIAFAALDNLGANSPEGALMQKMKTLLAPFLCLDGVNEKGVAIAVLTLDSKPTRQKTGKPIMNTCMAIRFVLDRAATTQEAVDLLGKYDMYASANRDYHFYITDASGDARAIEYDPLSHERKMIVTESKALTNFFISYKEKVLPNQKNGIYGHGRDRYDKIINVLNNQKNDYSEHTVWDALKVAAQDPNPKDITSNTQWSIVYNNSDFSADIAIRRHWKDITHFSFSEGKIKSSEK